MKDKNYYLVIDQGGGSTRAIVFDDCSNLIAKSRQTIDVEHPRLGWVEQDADNISRSVENVINEVMKQLGSNASRVTAAGLATQRSNVVCWRKSNGQALSPALSWQDRRAYQWMDQFSIHSQTIRQKTGLVVSPHYGVSKIRWCLENLDVVKQARTENDLSCGPLASYLVAKLTNSNKSLVDPANASRTLLWNVNNGRWDKQLLDLFALDDVYLPECVPTLSNFGEIAVEGHRIPLTVVTGDQSAALYAYGEPTKGTVYINMGTGVFIQYPTGNELVDVQGLLCSMVYSDGNRSEFVIESTINGGSNALVEVEEALGVSGDEAEKSLSLWFERYPHPPLFLNGVAGLAAPYWIPDFASRFIGDGTAEEKILAVAESILFLIKVNIDVMLKASQPIREIKITGGLSNSDCLCQKLANLLGMPITRAEQTEATAMGLAYLTAKSPDTWQVSGSWKTFTNKEDKLLHGRFHEWESEMSKAIQKCRTTKTTYVDDA